MFTDSGSKTDRSSRPPLECMVCGKLFPRGALDLARHQTAPTLGHSVSTKKSSTCKHGCSVCGHYFSTKEHLIMHSEQSSCGKKRLGFQIPDNECIVCKRLSLQYMCTNCGLYFISEEVIEQHMRESFCKRYHKTAETSSVADSNEVEVKSNKKVKRVVEENTSNAVDETQEFQPPSNKKSRISGSEGDKEDRAKSRATKTISETNLRRTSRAKSILPIERKALYAICSLLVDKVQFGTTSVPPNEENILSRIPDEKKGLIGKLMENLSHNC